MTMTAMKQNELNETQRHNRQQELIDTAKTITGGLGSLASIYVKGLPKALNEAKTGAKSYFQEMDYLYNGPFKRNKGGH